MFKKKIALLTVVAMVAALAMPVAASDRFTASPDLKPAPDLVVDEEGNAGTIIDEEGEEIETLTPPEIIITPWADREEAEEDIRERLEEAFDDLSSADELEDLCDRLDDVIAEYDPELASHDLEIRDLFDVDLYDEDHVRIVQLSDTQLVITLKVADLENLVAVLHHEDGTDWYTLPRECVINNGDGTVTIILNTIGPVALLFDSGILDFDPEGPTSPGTGAYDYTSAGAVVIAMAGITAAAATVICKKHLGKSHN